jgi:hypothetical protein
MQDFKPPSFVTEERIGLRYHRAVPARAPPFNYFTDFHEIWYEYYAIEASLPKFITIRNKKCQARQVVRWEDHQRHLI